MLALYANDNSLVQHLIICALTVKGQKKFFRVNWKIGHLLFQMTNVPSNLQKWGGGEEPCDCQENVRPGY